MSLRRVMRYAISASIISAALAMSAISVASAATTGVLLPSADGTYKQWTPNSGTTHYTRVNESTCDGNTSYNSTDVVSNRDSYAVTISSIPVGSTITEIDISPCASRDASGGTSPVMNVFYRFKWRE